MGNCLVTKLKSVVQNDNLLPLGVGIIDINITQPADSCLINCSGSTVLKIHGTGTITDKHGTSSSTEITIFNGENFTLSAGTYQIYYDKYNAVPNTSGKTGIKIYTKDLEYSNYTQLPGLFAANVLNGDIKHLNKFTNITAMYVPQSPAYGDIATLPGTALVNLNIGSTEISGNIASLSKYQSLGILTIVNSKVTGSLESLVAAYRAAGVNVNPGKGIKIAANYYSNTSCTQVTFNGAALDNSTQQALTWTADTITFNGVTINA